MGNHESTSTSTSHEDTLEEMASGEERRRIREKIDANAFLKDKLTNTKHDEDTLDFGNPDWILEHLLQLEKIISYTRPFSALEVLSREQKKYNGEEKTTSQTKKPMVVPLSRKTYEIKMIITEVPTLTDANAMFSDMRLGPMFGTFHASLVIGPYIVEWTDSSLIIPRECLLSPHMSFPIESNLTEEQLKQRVVQLAKEIARYNIENKYNSKTCNCMHFIDDVCSEWQLELKPIGQLKTFLENLRRNGISECRYKVPEKIAEMIKQRGINLGVDIDNEICFIKHEQLDRLVNSMQQVDSTYFNSDGVDDIKLLRSYDQAFFIRHFKYMVENGSLQDGEFYKEAGEIAHDDYKPLMFSKEKGNGECFCWQWHGCFR